MALEVDDVPMLLDELLNSAMVAVGGDRGFIALANTDSGELSLVATAGEGWTDEIRARRLRIDEGPARGKSPRTGITAHVAATGKAYVTGDVYEDPYYLAFFVDVASEVGVPIIDGNGHSRGVINIQSRTYHYFTDDHVRILRPLADTTAMRLQMDGYRARETALVEIGKDLSAIADITELTQRVVDVAADMLRFEDCSLFVLNKDNGQLVLHAARGGLSNRIGNAAYPMGDGLTGWVGQHGEAIRILDPSADPRWKGRYEELPAAEVGAFLAVPVYGRHGVLGVLRVLRRKSVALWFRREFTEDDESVLMTIASQLGAAIENSRILDRLVNTERMAAWGEMSAKAAHMIGNRAFAIKGDLNELEYWLSEPDDRRVKFRELAAAIRKGMYRLDELLQEFRDFVRATQISLQECDINDIVQQCIAESFPKRSKIELTLDLADKLPTVMADAARLKRAFSELIENSVSFQPDGGCLIVRTRVASRSEAQKRVQLPRAKQYIRIDFLDAGPGIPDDVKPHIFRPFYTSRARGMGLGLSIVKGIIEAHRGNIIEQGKGGRGAEFVAFLPAVAE